MRIDASGCIPDDATPQDFETDFLGLNTGVIVCETKCKLGNLQKKNKCSQNSLLPIPGIGTLNPCLQKERKDMYHTLNTTCELDDSHHPSLPRSPLGSTIDTQLEEE